MSVMTHDKMLLLKFMIQGTKKFKSYEDFDVKTSILTCSHAQNKIKQKSGIKYQRIQYRMKHIQFKIFELDQT